MPMKSSRWIGALMVQRLPLVGEIGYVIVNVLTDAFLSYDLWQIMQVVKLWRH